MAKSEVYNHCNSCDRKTYHTVEGGHSYTSDDDYNQYKVSHQVVKCKGCSTVSFRKEYHDYDEAFQQEDGEWDYPLTVETYPKSVKESVKKRYLPELVSEIYSETCSAYSQGYLVLAGIGLRATIEAICNEQNINGKELSTRINNLANQGLISKKDSSRLHSIRFLGNDAAHEIARPTQRAFKAALIIVEHLLTTVYVLDAESKGKLISVIQEYNQFEELLIKNLGSHKIGDEYPLVHILGKDFRRLIGSTGQLEKKLDERIGKGEFNMLEFGKKEKFEKSPTELQHYIVRAVP
ncbi:DUF4145 domain-containing protein [Massilia timonae]|uniref:DUF4145 domain-containing protein n=1 Tax=Massilia timonae TaxID=47229 RepID=UPI0028D2F4D4|nr:DUF4145 domain-containing protein [Massilia timonae]